MTLLSASASIDCPPAATQLRLAEYFASLCKADGVARMRLRVPMTNASGALALALSREVRIEVQPVPKEQDLDDRIFIAWEPEGRTVLPRFEGTLVVRADECNGSWIELDGSYRPPFDGVGQIFDNAIGHRIAESTAREFLKDLKRAIEQPRILRQSSPERSRSAQDDIARGRRA